VFQAGIPEWKKNGMPMISEPDGLKKMIFEEESYVLVDLRSKETAVNGHIKGAVSIPLAQLAEAEDLFPADKSAPVILYDEHQAGRQAFATIRGWGFKNATILNGGAKGWTGRFFSGDPGSKIVYVKRIRPDQVGIDEFNKIAADKPADKVILDVRDGATDGIIPGAMTIPHSQLQKRMAELPRDRELIVHCNTGILAGMAVKTLRENGYRARYLDAVVQVAANGDFGVDEK
jgi:rhodanese-related sulfurtransferase